MSLLKSIGVLSIGQGLAQLISLLGYVFLARFYSPDYFGAFALVLAISTLVSGVSSFGYEMTILLPKSKVSANLAINLSLLLSILVHLLLSILVIIYLLLSGWESVVNWLFAILISFFNSILNISTFIQNREKRYKKIVAVSIIRNTCFLCFSLFFLVLKLEKNGLILSYLLATFFLSIYLFYSEFNFKNLTTSYQKIYRLKMWFFKHHEFFKFTTPAVFCSLAAQNTPIFLITAFLGEAAAGIYSMVNRIIMAPVGLISREINRIYLQQVSELRYKSLPIWSFTKKLIRNITIPSLILCFFSIYLFKVKFLEFIFGYQWQGIDYIAMLFIPVMFISFISKAIAGFSVLGKNFLGLVYQLILLVVVSFSIVIAYMVYGQEAIIYKALSFSLSLVYLMQIFSIIKISKKYDKGLHK